MKKCFYYKIACDGVVCCCHGKMYSFPIILFPINSSGSVSFLLYQRRLYNDYKCVFCKENNSCKDFILKGGTELTTELMNVRNAGCHGNKKSWSIKKKKINVKKCLSFNVDDYIKINK